MTKEFKEYKDAMMRTLGAEEALEKARIEEEISLRKWQKMLRDKEKSKE